MRIKRAFTLIELLVVLAILAVASALVGLGIRQALVDQRFRSEVNMVVQQLRVAQDLMLFASADAYVKFSTDSHGHPTSRIEVKTRIPPFLEKQVDLSPRVYSTLKRIEFFDYGNGEHSLTAFDLEFGSRGTSMTRGTLRLSAGDTVDWVREIDLIGSPGPIVSRRSDSTHKEDPESGQQLYERLTQNIQQQFPENDPLRAKPAERQQNEQEQGRQQQQPQQPKGKE